MALQEKSKPHPDTSVILRESARRLDGPTRRLFLRQAAGLGTLTLLGGCDVVEGVSAERALARMSDFNDRVQAWLFDPRRLARQYPESAITRPFPFNAFCPEGQSPEVDPDSYRLELAGSVEDRTPWTLDRLHALPRVTQVTRHICIEGWSAVGKWSGVRFWNFSPASAPTRARFT